MILPDVQRQRPVARPTRAIAQVSQSAAGAVGRGVEAIGGQVTEFGDAMFDRETTAMATERDTIVSDQIRDLIYNPETGFAGLKGSGAVGARQATIEKLEGLKATAFDGLNKTAQRKLQTSFDRRITSAKDAVERHTLGERDNWLSGASAARVQSAFQDSLSNPAETTASLEVIESEIRAQGIREGWGAERTRVELDASKSKVFADQVTRIAASDPIAAMDYMRQNQGRMVASDIVNIESELQPKVKEHLGRMKAQELFTGGAEISMGTRAVNRPTSEVTNISLDFNASENTSARGTEVIIPDDASPELRAAAETFNQGVVDFAAKHGLSQPNRGVKTRSENGRGVRNTVHVEPFFRDNIDLQKAVEADFTAFSKIYEDSFGHLEGVRIIPPHGVGADRGAVSEVFGNETAFGKRVVKSLIDGKEGAVSDVLKVRQILDIPDPVERQAALREANLRMAANDAARKATRDQAQDQAFQVIEGGGSLDSLPSEFKAALGQAAMTSLYSYQAMSTRGEPIRTDDGTYYELRQMQANDPAGFNGLNLIEYRDKLDDGDWQKMVDAQTKPVSEIKTSAASTLMTTASRHLTAAGFDATPKEGSADAELTSKMQTRLLRWQDDFVEKNGVAPSQTEIDDRVRRELLPVVMDAPGLRGDSKKKSRTLLEISDMNLSETQLADTSINVLDTDVPPAVINEQIIALREAGVPVTPENLLERIVLMFEAANLR